MRHLYHICKFELLRLFANWKRTLKLFLVPALVMVLALYAFPMLVNYLSTGSLGRTDVLVVNGPKEFFDFANDLNMGTIYKFKDTPEEVVIGHEKEHTDKGAIIICFEPSYEEDVREYYKDFETFYKNYKKDEIITREEFPETKAKINVFYNDTGSFYSRVLQFEQDVMEKFLDKYPDLVEIDRTEIKTSYTSTNSFNPILKILNNRSVANEHASRIVPQILILMLYYCVYSLSLDIFAGDRERGFLNKMLLTPVSSKTIVWGKIITISTIAVISSIVMFFMLFLVSWLNFSNDSLSLLPFGMFLLPNQLLKLLLITISEALMMTSFCAWIIFDLRKPQDITINLQLPLALILVDLFVFMIYQELPEFIEYFIPIHNALATMNIVIQSHDDIFHFSLTIIANIAYTFLILRKVFKKEELL